MGRFVLRAERNGLFGPGSNGPRGVSARAMLTPCPRSVPPSLRSSFEKAHIDYDVNHASQNRWATSNDEITATGRKQKFGDAYLTRLGVCDRAANYGARAKGTDFGGRTTEDWEEVRLKKQLREPYWQGRERTIV